MLKMMEESESIEDAMSKIVQRGDLFGMMNHQKSVRRFCQKFMINYNLGTTTTSFFSLAKVDIGFILSYYPGSESKQQLDRLLFVQFPLVMTNPELRKDYLNLSLLHDLDWLAPLVVLLDYFIYY